MLIAPLPYDMHRHTNTHTHTHTHTHTPRQQLLVSLLEVKAQFATLPDVLFAVVANVYYLVMFVSYT